MCVALPGTVIETGSGRSIVDFGGNRVEARSGLVDVKKGDRVLVHAGCILQKVSEDEALELERLFHDLEEAAG